MWRYAEMHVRAFDNASKEIELVSSHTSPKGPLGFATSGGSSFAEPSIDPAAAEPSEPAASFDTGFSLSRWTVRYPWNATECSFESSSMMLDRVYTLCKDTLHLTSLDTFTDSNTRERLPYEADMFITGRSRYAFYPRLPAHTRTPLGASTVCPLMIVFMIDFMIDTFRFVFQSDDRLYRHSVEEMLNNPTWPTEWKQWTIFLVHELYMQTGDTSIAHKYFGLLINNTMMRFIDNQSSLIDWTPFLVKPHKPSWPCHSTAGMFPPGVTDGGQACDIVDWQPQYRAGFVFTTVNTVVNAFAVKSLELLAELANTTGREAFAGAATAQAKRTRQAMLTQMYNAESGLWCDGMCSNTTSATFHTQHFLLWLGITPETGVKKALITLKAYGMKGSVYSAYSLLHGLYSRASNIDYGHTPLELMTQCTNQSWYCAPSIPSPLYPLPAPPCALPASLILSFAAGATCLRVMLPPHGRCGAGTKGRTPTRGVRHRPRQSQQE
jgi:hypothetical protein